jgi:hypothetical protein
MTMKRLGWVLLLGFLTGPLLAQDQPLGGIPGAAPDAPGARRHEPPQLAYDDCKGKKAGDTVQHTTPEGKVAATCVDSPKGLVARPIRGKDSESKAKGTAR